MAKRFEDSDVLVMDDESTECAWCKLELNYQLHKYNRVPSYVERFRKR